MSTKQHFNNIFYNAAFYLVILTTFFTLSSQWAVDDSGCRTPNRGVGTCIPIKSCTHIINFLMSSPKPLSQKAAQTLRSYQCGFQGDIIKVCCPNQPIPLIEDDDVVDEPPDVLSHRNYNLLPLDTCGPLGNGDRIIGGNKTHLFEYPWMALLSYQTSKGPSFRCGGTVINDRYILTAAHCITNLAEITLSFVRVGEHDISTEKDCEIVEDERICSPPYQDLRIEEAIPHPNYNNPPYRNDIGLIRVATSINLRLENIKPVCLPVTKETRNFNFTNKNVIITGWGATETGLASPALLQVEIATVPFEECRNKYTRQANITQKQMCAGGKNQKDSCQGDSGGPLQTASALNRRPKMVQYGVVSFGPKFCATEGNPGVYTKIAFYMDWLLDNLRP